MTAWEIKGREFGNCNCDYSCPCQFNALPTHGHCRGLAVLRHRGRLPWHDAARRAPTPPGSSAGPVPFTKAKARACTSSTDAPRRHSARPCAHLARRGYRTVRHRFSGLRLHLRHAARADRSPISSSSSTSRAAQRGPRSTASLEMRGAPILNPVTGAEHRVRIVQPNGFEFAEAEIGRGWSKANGPVAYELDDSLWPIRPDPSLPERHGALKP